MRNSLILLALISIFIVGCAKNTKVTFFDKDGFNKPTCKETIDENPKHIVVFPLVRIRF